MQKATHRWPGAFGWRREPELNRCTRFCRPVPNHSAIAPWKPERVRTLQCRYLAACLACTFWRLRRSWRRRLFALTLSCCPIRARVLSEGVATCQTSIQPFMPAAYCAPRVQPGRRPDQHSAPPRKRRPPTPPHVRPRRRGDDQTAWESHSRART